MIDPLLLCNFVVVMSSVISGSEKKSILIKLLLTTVLLCVVEVVTAMSDTHVIIDCGHMIICNSLIAFGSLINRNETRSWLLGRISITTVIMFIVGVLIDILRGA